ncbi:hypothetical protein ONE63_010363 [Megalurothrips usitatus]|uniref:Uncharacterized protein n=1 Tax=Megalurothrips usitatus TaxID=439358 RepID=A0AAV7XLB1_9NEOP|nr:hypothetical protein ONE63_010363 [Megalurothrips usitatus]
MAVCVDAMYPKLSNKAVWPTDKPWTYLFDRSNNNGYFARAIAHQQRQLAPEKRARGGGTEKRKRAKTSVSNEVPVVQSADDLELSNEVNYLRNIVARDCVKPDILTSMRDTFKERRYLINNESKRLSVSTLIDAFPHLLSFEGEVIDQEFSLLHNDKKDNLLRNFHQYSAKLLKMAESNPKKYPPDLLHHGNAHLSAFVILANFLPKPRRSYPWEESMNPTPVLYDFYQSVPMGSNVEYEIEQRRQLTKYPIQPYILNVGTRMFIVLGNSEWLALPRECSTLQGVDFLIKACYALDTPYYLGWKNVFRFLTVYLYNITPDHQRLSVFAEQHRALMQIQ